VSPSNTNIKSDGATIWDVIIESVKENVQDIKVSETPFAIHKELYGAAVVTVGTASEPVHVTSEIK
jgi:hypothetical protein